MILTTSIIVYFVHKDDDEKDICLVEGNDATAGEVLYLTGKSGKLSMCKVCILLR